MRTERIFESLTLGGVCALWYFVVPGWRRNSDNCHAATTV